MYTEITFSMAGMSSAPAIVGALLVPQSAQYSIRWFDRGDRAYVSLLVPSSVVEQMVAKVCRMHPSMRCVSRNERNAETVA